MTWSIASFAVLSVALTGGFAWYERSHPSAKVLALVATLAALAALGRIAFAPLPSVKPTSDIVFISGFALGGPPGFAVGAVAALTSNVFFGQGPWTPWQMGAWGAVGIFGALVARLTRGRAPRLPLALACGVCGLAFGTVMNVFTWLTFSDPDSGGGGLIVIAGRALPFDVAHAIGNVAFFLAFGPALIAAIKRFRARFEIDFVGVAGERTAGGAGDGSGGGGGRGIARGPGRGLTGGAGAGAATVLAALVLAGAVALAAPPRAQAATSVGFLAAAQNGDGGWGGGKGQSSTQLFSGWAALGLAASGRSPADVHKGSGASALAYVRRNLKAISDLGEVERTVLVLRAAGMNPRSFGGRDLVAEILGRRKAGGSIGGQSTYTAFGLMALRAGGLETSSPAVKRATAWLAAQQGSDGGFSTFGKGGASTTDDTGAALLGLNAGGRRGRTAARAVGYLRRQQAATGGFPLSPGGTVNAQSTAFAALGLRAAGLDPDSVRHGGRGVLGYLRSLTSADGSVSYSRTSRQTPVWVTAQVLLALSGKTLPLDSVAIRPTKQAASAPAASSDESSGTAGATAAKKAKTTDRRTAAPAALSGPERSALARRLSLARVLGEAAGVAFKPLS